MALTLYSLLEASLLFLNAVAVLNRQRFLSKIGLSQPSYQSYGDEGGSVKQQLVTGIYAVQTVMRCECCVQNSLGCNCLHLVPLIFVNVFIILLKLVFG